MKKLLINTLVALTIATGLFASTGASAYWCRFVPGYWAGGAWHYGHRVCWGGGGPLVNQNCPWIPGHWFKGRWIPGHRNC